jgi:hypothetical protein
LGEPWKAERTPVPGAGFSPEAVPSKSGLIRKFKEPAVHIEEQLGREVRESHRCSPAPVYVARCSSWLKEEGEMEKCNGITIYSIGSSVV